MEYQSVDATKVCNPLNLDIVTQTDEPCSVCGQDGYYVGWEVANDGTLVQSASWCEACTRNERLGNEKEKYEQWVKNAMVKDYAHSSGEEYPMPMLDFGNGCEIVYREGKWRTWLGCEKEFASHDLEKVQHELYYYYVREVVE